MGALFGFQSHCGKADGQTMIGDDLHKTVIHHDKVKLLGDDIDGQQACATKKGGGNQTLAGSLNT